MQFTSQASQLKYRPDIDGLRAVAVLSVIAFHAFPRLAPAGFIGVDIFFVISGFLISSIIFEALDRGDFSFADFYSRRIRRIFPALSVVLLACLALGWVVLVADELNQLGKHIFAGAVFISNFVLVDEAGYFDNAAETKPLLHLWSLGIEEQFYVVWPLLLWAAWKTRFNPLGITLSIVTISLILNIHLVTREPIVAFYSPFTRFWELLSGSILAFVVLYRSPSLNSTSANTSSVVGSALLVLGFSCIPAEQFPGYWALIPVLGSAFIILAGPTAWINRKILSSRVAVWFGLISYSLYLWHWPLLSFARIVENGDPPVGVRTLAVILAIALAWFSTRFVESLFRRRSRRNGLKISVLCVSLAATGLAGFWVSRMDLSLSHGFETRLLTRKGSEHAISTSLKWYRGKGDWLYLGNDYDNTVAKLSLAIVPSSDRIRATKETFEKLAASGSKYNTKTALFIGPNKSSVYSEYLPDNLKASPERYIGFFLDELTKINNLVVYDPTDLLRSSKSNGLLYWMTDTHWNDRGAYVAFTGFAELLGVRAPDVEFRRGRPRAGDLIGISKLKNFPLHAEDNWDVIWRDRPAWTEVGLQDASDSFGPLLRVVNHKPLSQMYVWVVGDSFQSGLRKYFNATFKEIWYLGHWRKKLKDLPQELDKAKRKPDLIVVVRVERSF